MTSNMFQKVYENQPDLWIWMGDAAYTDNVRIAGCKTLII